MTEIQNPIIPGMAPDPSIIRVGEDYYIATSTFHWNPGIQIFHSKDLVNWDLLTHVLQHGEVNLRGTNTPAGIWAPHLSYDEKNGLFWLAYCHMQNMAGREFNSESYAMYAKDITGPWSEPIYLTSIGFDPSLYHDEDGHHYLSILEWETRLGYQAPGHLVIAEADLENGGIKGNWHRVSTDFTTRGCVEAPQIYKHDGWFYLLAASGGTGYGHGIEIGRAKHVFGPYEPNPTGEPIITSSPRHLFSLGDPDAGHFEMYNPHSIMQKAGHGSLVETPNHEFYIAHLMSRPLPGTTLNPLGRETSLQKVIWNEDGWLEMADGSNLAKMSTPAPAGITNSRNQELDDVFDDFKGDAYNLKFMTPYHEQNASWVGIVDNQLMIKGANSLFSQVSPSIMATRATSLDYSLQTKVTFDPVHYSQTAGAGLYYDSNNWLYASLHLDDKEQKLVLGIIQAKLGEKIDYVYDQVEVPGNSAEIKINYHLGTTQIYCRFNENDEWIKVGKDFDVSYLSDEGVNGEPGEIGGFTGLFNFIGSVDAYQHDSAAAFDYYQVKNGEK